MREREQKEGKIKDREKERMIERKRKRCKDGREKNMIYRKIK